MSNNNSNDKEIMYFLDGGTLQERQQQLQHIIEQYQDEIESIDYSVLRGGEALAVSFVYRDELQPLQQRRQQEDDDDDSFFNTNVYITLAMVVPMILYYVWGAYLYKLF